MNYLAFCFEMGCVAQAGLKLTATTLGSATWVPGLEERV